MGFHHDLCIANRPLPEALFALPFARDALAGRITAEEYGTLLAQAWHVVRHAPALLGTAAARLPDRHAWLRPELAHAAEAHHGRDERLLADLARAGGDARAVRASEPELPAELLVAFAWDVVLRREPVGLLGLAHVFALVGVRGASRVVDNLRPRLGLPEEAFGFLQAHGTAGLPRVDRLASLLDRIDDAGDRRWIAHVSQVTYRLAAGILASLPVDGAIAAPEEALT